MPPTITATPFAGTRELKDKRDGWARRVLKGLIAWARRYTYPEPRPPQRSTSVMDRIKAYVVGLKNPLEMMKLLGWIGALAVAYATLASLGGKPKPWEDSKPHYLTGEMSDFVRTFPTQAMPTIALTGEDGEVTLAEVADGRTLVVNLWATWCAPCLEELPTLEALQREHGDEVQVVLVAVEPGDGSAQRAMLERLGVSSPTLLLDPRLRFARTFSENLTLPITVVYDGRGREVGSLVGNADWNAPEAVRLVRAIGAGALPR